MSNSFKVGSIVAASILAVVLIGGAMGLSRIEAGYAGVVYNTNGGIEDQTLPQGWHWIWPWKKVIEYPVSTETVYLTKVDQDDSKGDQSFNVSTSEGKPVSVDIMYSYHMEPDKLPKVFTKFRGAPSSAIEAGYIKSTMKAVIQGVTSRYGVLDIYGEKRGEITEKVYTELSKRLDEVGIALETFSFGEIRPDDNSMLAIQAKVDAQQKLQQYETEKAQAQVLADKARIEAKGNADRAVIEAEGKAQANAKIKQSLTPELIQMEWIKKWDGKQPYVSGNGSNIVQIPAPAAGK
ncbi:prohibitin family protein [Paenibacillus alvei]|uniref:prohibitin family protein n=1 Tax=Paenibacillus alvei TaxID=44250 RepID=UPI00227F54AF|nr:prohibitin family protein [Paenibacillus alvei]MCY9737533.1 prohibitin family protein [Paenibacillus alvei]